VSAEDSFANARCPRKHFVENRAQRENVRPRIGRLAAHLLGRHVPDRAQYHPGFRLARILCRPRRHLRFADAGSIALRELGQPEIQNFHAAVVG
jgi:hypothetical protein